VRVGVAFLAAAVLLAGCASRWPEENAAAFEQSCLTNARRSRPEAPEEAHRAYCRCALDRLQARYSLSEFEALETQSVREQKPALELLRVVEECAGRVR
jgi:hypothetical protein